MFYCIRKTNQIGDFSSSVSPAHKQHQQTVASGFRTARLCSRNMPHLPGSALIFNQRHTSCEYWWCSFVGGRHHTIHRCVRVTCNTGMVTCGRAEILKLKAITPVSELCFDSPVTKNCLTVLSACLHYKQQAFVLVRQETILLFQVTFFSLLSDSFEKSNSKFHSVSRLRWRLCGCGYLLQ